MHAISSEDGELSEEDNKELKEKDSKEFKESKFWSKHNPFRAGNSEDAVSEEGGKEEKKENSEKERKSENLLLVPRERQRELDLELGRHNSWLGSMDTASYTSLHTLPNASSCGSSSLSLQPTPSSLSSLLSTSNALYTMESANGKEVFYLGVIDFLAQYRFKKKSAHFFKVVFFLSLFFFLFLFLSFFLFLFLFLPVPFFFSFLFPFRVIYNFPKFLSLLLRAFCGGENHSAPSLRVITILV